MSLTRILLALIVASLCSCTAAEECPPGVFTTDRREIAASFAKPNETTNPSTQGSGSPREITEIRDGIVNWWAGAFINDGLQSWNAYDADRHLFLNVQASTGRFAVKPESLKLGPGQTYRQEGGWGYVITSVPATPQQARRFACLANALVNSPPPKPDPSFSTRMTDTLALASTILKDAKRIRQASDSDRLSRWFSLATAEPFAKAMGTWVPPHVFKLATDSADNLYLLVDPGSIRGPWVGVVKITPSGQGTDRSARLPNDIQPMSLAADRAGRVLLPARNGIVYELPPGLVSPDPVTQRNLHLQETGLFKGAPWLSDIALDRNDNMYTAATSQLIRVTPDGLVTVLAGNAEQGHQDGVGAAASLDFPSPIAVAPNGDVFIADRYNSIIRKVTPDGIVTTLAGVAGQAGFADGMGADAKFSHPEGISVDGQGTIYVADTDNDAVRRISPIGRVTLLAGAVAVPGSTDGKGTDALFDRPTSIAVDSRGTVYVSSGRDNIIRKIYPDGKVSSWNVQKWIRPVDIDSLL
jgi:sugar lactone lactonase YvrE